MKKGIQTGLILAAAGLLLYAAGYAMSESEPEVSRPGAYHKRTVVSNAAITEFTLEDSNTDITLSPSEDGAFRVTYYENDRERYEVDLDEEGGSLRMEKQVDRKWYEWIGHFTVEAHPVKVEIPASALAALKVRTSNASISLDGLNGQGMELVSSNGQIRVTDAACAKGISASTSNARVIIENTRAGGILSASSSNGDISMLKVQGKNVKADTSNARVTMNKAAAEEDVAAFTTNGDIELNTMVFGGSLEARTSNSSIRGTIDGRRTDYSISSGTSNGDNNLPNGQSGGEKSISVHTSNGSIDFTFLKD